MNVIADRVKTVLPDLFVPQFLRVSPILNPGTKLIGFCDRSSDKPELFFSQFPFDSWPDLWSIDLEYTSRKGIFRNITKFLTSKKAKVRILCHMISPVSGSGSRAKLILDLTSYGDGPPDETSGRRRNEPVWDIPLLRDCISHELIDVLKIVEGIPQIGARRLEEHRRAWKSYDGAVEDEDDVEMKFNAEMGENGILSLPTKIADVLAQEAQTDEFLITCDPQEQCFRCIPHTQELTTFVMEIYHTDQPDSLAKFSKILTELEINIKSAYQNLTEAGGLCAWRFLAESDDLSAEQVKAELEERMSAQEEERDENFRVVLPTAWSPSSNPGTSFGEIRTTDAT